MFRNLKTIVRDKECFYCFLEKKHSCSSEKDVFVEERIFGSFIAYLGPFGRGNHSRFSCRLFAKENYFVRGRISEVSN